MSIEESVHTEGWMSTGELAWLSAQARQHQSIVEVGCYMGRTTSVLAETPGVVYAVDNFRGSEEHQPDLLRRQSSYLRDEFERNLNRHTTSGKVKVVQLDSKTAAQALSHLSFDMIFIDASHDYENVKADILAWIPLLRDGGLLCGHDYGANRNVDTRGLERAVRELLPGFQVVNEESIWYIRVSKQKKTIQKTIWTLNIDNYAPEVVKLTYPLLEHYAYKIGADFRVITERQFPGWPVVYEKLQIHELGAENDWNIYIDSDALVHPDMFDPTNHMKKDTIAHNGNDMAGNRWRYDRFFRRDGRHFGSCNWFTVGSDWCIDMWKPLDDLTRDQAVANIFPAVSEINSGCITADHLIDDYTLSRNIAKFGLKFTTIADIKEELNDKGNYLWHIYTNAIPEKVKQMKEVMRAWGIENYARGR